MIRNIHRTYFEIWGNEVAQNKILKGLLLIFVFILAIESVSLVILALRKPFVVAVSEEATKVLSPIANSPDLAMSEAKRVVSMYVKFHHEWDYSQIESRMKDAANLVHADYSKKFNKANQNQIRIAKDKKVSQKFYFDTVELSSDGKTARITGDRILNLQGLRATNPMTVEVGYTLGPRTVANPEGIYITSEKLIQGN